MENLYRQRKWLYEITSPSDPRFAEWMYIYETSFPPDQRQLTSEQIGLMQSIAEGTCTDTWFLAALDKMGKVYGIAQVLMMLKQPRAAALVYLAVHPDHRGQGKGARLYADVLERVTMNDCSAMLFEVEVPETMPTPARQNLAARRLGFYRRNGARVLEGATFTESVAPGQPICSWSIMVHPIKGPMKPVEGKELAIRLHRDGVRFDDDLRWD